MQSADGALTGCAPLSIGWAMQDITPMGKVRVQGQFHVRVSTGVHDPLTCTALALDSGQGRAGQAILVSVDGAYLVDEVMQACRGHLRSELPELAPQAVCVFATHTHTAPCQHDFWYPEELPEGVPPASEYAVFMARKMADTIQQAWAGRTPSQLSWGASTAAVAHNRRVHYEDGTGRMYGPTATPAFRHMEGGTDHTVNLLFTHDLEGELTGMIVNVATPAQSRESESYLSADFWHDTRCEIRTRHGDGVFVLAQCAMAGDQSPHPMLQAAAHLRMLHLKGLTSSPDLPPRCSEVTSAECQLIAMRLAAAVDDALPACLGDMRQNVPFFHTWRSLDLPCRMVTAEEARLCRVEADAARGRMAEMTPDPVDPAFTSCHSHVVYNQQVVDRFDRQVDRPIYAAEIHVLRIGDVAMAMVPFEIYLDYGLRIQQRSPARQTFTVQLLGQDEGNPALYLPTERAVKAGHYGGNVRDNKVGLPGGQLLVDEIVRTLESVWGTEERD
ncbi:MAG: hypothetical protein HN742_01670 [Lentisphaerae bacterium]|jgi:hypothetical protein|nr:hypothetical protein [Lentisphaerota bacterium]MBT4814932.1 hypothetical protein [Lentisphaerota bacterium]MBT5611088.1 hypothetical protein [Lentisphaerota bacterium]MBT7061843.1 hypothetical protein [Lentisphaerota bacterium]MBT7840544.1 hypothetical protein [Lentisphaerota bacterium]